MLANPEITESILKRFAPLKPEIVRTVEFADIMQVDSSSLFQGVHKQFLMVIVDSSHVEEALSQRKTWLTTLIYECLLAPSTVVPIILSNKLGLANYVDLIRRKGTEGVKGQPIIEYKNLEKSKEPAREILRRAIVHSEVRFKVNPYNVHSTAVRGMFFGRKEELQNIQTSQGHVFIVGARRIGKTSLVTRLVETINNEPKYPRIEFGGIFINDLAIQLDVSKQGEDISSTIWWAILNEFGITENRWRVYSRKTSAKKNKPVEDPAFALETLIDKANGRLTIVLDEMDGWVKREANLTWQTIERLRALTDAGRAKLILVGYEMFRKGLQNDRFPLYGRGKVIHLGPVDRTTLADLVTKPLADFDIGIEGEEIVTRIWKKTAGMPHVVQDVCKILLDDCLKESIKVITSHQVSRAFKKSEKYDEFVRGLINCPFPLAEAICGILSVHGREGAVEERLILNELSPFGYAFNGDEFQLALDYLILRYAIDDAGEFRWKMFNEGQREYMYHYISSKGFENWLSALIKKHNQGFWKKYYENVI